LGVIHPGAQVDSQAVVQEGAVIWNNSHVRDKAFVGENSIIGEFVYVDTNVVVGSNCKVQNGSYLYSPAILEDGVFIGPGVILTNDRFPRAIQVDGTLKGQNDWQEVGVVVRTGASIGAGAICVAPIEVGEWSLIAAGSVVTKNVPRFALVSGNPAKFVKWVGRSGFPLIHVSTHLFECPKTGERYLLKEKNSLVLA